MGKGGVGGDTLTNMVSSGVLRLGHPHHKPFFEVRTGQDRSGQVWTSMLSKISKIRLQQSAGFIRRDYWLTDSETRL